MPKNRRRWFFSLGLLAAAVGAIGLTGCGHRCWRHHGHDPTERVEWATGKIASRLDLNDAQKAKLDIVKQEILAHREQGRQEREEAFRTILAQIRSKRLDSGKLLALMEQRHGRMEEIAPSVLRKVADFHASLTDEQKEKAAQELEKMRDHRR
ncbi:MAG: Spy/CpxP family protein refolding chaperone [Candidatus Deferrimicrobiaceae bacterium]